MSNTIYIKTAQREFTIDQGKPVLVRWKSKNKSRPGTSVGLGWLLPGENRHTVKLVHSTFQTYDQVEQEYPASWTIWTSSILDIHEMRRTK